MTQWGRQHLWSEQTDDISGPDLSSDSRPKTLSIPYTDAARPHEFLQHFVFCSRFPPLHLLVSLTCFLFCFEHKFSAVQTCQAFGTIKYEYEITEQEATVFCRESVGQAGFATVVDHPSVS